MSLGPVNARKFWKNLDSENKNSFVRGISFRSSFNQPGNLLQPKPIIPQSIYCTIRNPKSRRSISTPGQRAKITTVPSPTLKSTFHYPTETQRRLETKAMSENDISLPTNKKLDNHRAPKRYETSCFFKPLAVPVWYSSSVTLKTNSTKKKYTESVTYKQKLVPYRYVEKMSTITYKPPKFVSKLEIHRESSVEHFLSLEAQQTAALNKSYKSDHSIKVDKYI